MRTYLGDWPSVYCGGCDPPIPSGFAALSDVCQAISCNSKDPIPQSYYFTHIRVVEVGDETYFIRRKWKLVILNYFREIIVELKKIGHRNINTGTTLLLKTIIN